MKNFKTQDEFISALKKVSKPKRSSLSGKSFYIKDKNNKLESRIEVGDLVGREHSYLVYQVTMEVSHKANKNMLMKEFFPEDLVGIRDRENPREIHYINKSEEDKMALSLSRKRFIADYYKGIEIISKDKNFDEKVIKPSRLIEERDYLLSFYEIDEYKAIDEYDKLDFGRAISIISQAVDIISLFHQENIIYMNLTPANIFYDYNNDRVKLFATDAAVFLDGIDDVTEFYLPNQRSFIPPELRFISNIENRKKIFVSEDIDLYMLGVTLFFLLVGRYPCECENEDSEYLEKSLREVMAKDNKRIFVKEEVRDELVDLLKKSLSMHRYLNLSDFRDGIELMKDGIL